MSSVNTTLRTKCSTVLSASPLCGSVSTQPGFWQVRKIIRHLILANSCIGRKYSNKYGMLSCTAFFLNYFQNASVSMRVSAHTQWTVTPSAAWDQQTSTHWNRKKQPLIQIALTLWCVKNCEKFLIFLGRTRNRQQLTLPRCAILTSMAVILGRRFVMGCARGTNLCSSGCPTTCTSV